MIVLREKMGSRARLRRAPPRHAEVPSVAVLLIGDVSRERQREGQYSHDE